jgi:hypothetical protein
MGAAISLEGLLARAEVPQVTLWELVWAVSQVADNEREVIATVAHMLESGSVRLCGNFRDCPIHIDLRSSGS